MLAALFVEARKLNRSLAALLAVIAPTLIAVFTFFMVLRGKTAQPWDMWMVSGAGIWAFFMLPMSVTALTALVAHMEHGPKSWDHLRALPVARWKLYAAKAICVLGVVALMSLAVFGFSALLPAFPRFGDDGIGGVGHLPFHSQRRRCQRVRPTKSFSRAVGLMGDARKRSMSSTRDRYP